MQDLVLILLLSPPSEALPLLPHRLHHPTSTRPNPTRQVPSSSFSSPDDLGPPQEAVLKAISEVSKSEGRVAQTTNVVIGGTVTDDATNEWFVLDQKVNLYPMSRGFTAIGTGGDDFVQARVVAVEFVLQQPIPKGRMTQKMSSRGKYVSINIGPMHVVSSEQVQAVYNAMRRDDRMKYFVDCSHAIRITVHMDWHLCIAVAPFLSFSNLWQSVIWSRRSQQ